MGRTLSSRAQVPLNRRPTRPSRPPCRARQVPRDRDATRRPARTRPPRAGLRSRWPGCQDHQRAEGRLAQGLLVLRLAS
jgi:hypothetical protein